MLRGLLVIVLVLVEYLPPRPELSWLQHSPWDGVRVADFVFPGYLFVSGASLAVARQPSWARLVRRTALLVAIGLVFNAFTETSPLRFTGVLQTIAVAGLLAAIVVRYVRRADDVALVAGVLLFVHGVFLRSAFDVDRFVFPDTRLYREGGAGHDPEGVLATVLGATALVLLGWVATRTRSWWTVAALVVAAAVASVAWAPNKRAWSPTFTLLMALTFAVALLVLRPIPLPLLGSVGRNALLVYVGQHVVREVSGPFDDVGFAVAATAAWAALAIVLGRIGIRLRV